MAEQSGRSKARKGERCPNCGHRKYRIDNGLRFCRNCGAQSEGYVQYDMGDDADAGLMGSVSRQRKEKHEKERRHLSGLKGKSLYLEALQLVLRHQLQWLIREKGHLSELESVVRDLWAVRIAGFPEDTEDGSGDQGSQMFSSSGFSSGGEEETLKAKRAPHAKSWDPESSSQWPVPSMIDTLALCYLGCLLLRLPTTISEFHHWANTGNIPFRAVYYSIPQEMQDRMPAEFTKQLKRPTRERLADTSLHHAVFDLVCSYHLNYSMIFPAPNASTTFVQFVKALALPVETAVVAMHLSTVLKLTYQFPIKQSRVHIVDHPEIRMMALLVVSAKLCYSLDGKNAALSWIQSIPRLDWRKWKTAYDERTPERQPPEHEKYEGITATQVSAMPPEELTEYLAHLASRHDHRNDSAITGFFQKPTVPGPAPPTQALSADEIIERSKAIVQEATSGLPGLPFDETAESSSGNKYLSFASVESLSETARTVFAAAAETSGTSLAELTRAVRMLENKMMVWGRAQGRAGTEEVDPSGGALVAD